MRAKSLSQNKKAPRQDGTCLGAFSGVGSAPARDETRVGDTLLDSVNQKNTAGDTWNRLLSKVPGTAVPGT